VNESARPPDEPAEAGPSDSALATAGRWPTPRKSARLPGESAEAGPSDSALVTAGRW